MEIPKLSFIILTTVVVLGCSSHNSNARFTPASENACNVSCGYDAESYQACFEIPAVSDYAKKLLQSELYPTVVAIFEEEPPGACICGLAVLDDSGKFVSVTIADISNASIGDEVRAAIFRHDAIPIPLGAECIVGIELPISFGY